MVRTAEDVVLESPFGDIESRSAFYAWVPDEARARRSIVASGEEAGAAGRLTADESGPMALRGIGNRAWPPGRSATAGRRGGRGPTAGARLGRDFGANPFRL